jgi:2-keto-3-deoxy-L-rhamnonate aldolase RhmA
MAADDLTSILRNRVAERLAADEVAVSMTVRLVESVEIAQIAATCGYDSLYIDIEHSPLTLHQTGQICVAALGAGITPFVRVPAHGPEYVSRVLDAGAMGVIAPHVRSAAEARAVVEAANQAFARLDAWVGA